MDYGVIIIIFGAVIGVAAFLLRKPSIASGIEALKKDNELAKKQAVEEAKVLDLKNKLNVENNEKTPEEIENFWNKK